MELDTFSFLSNIKIDERRIRAILKKRYPFFSPPSVRVRTVAEIDKIERQAGREVEEDKILVGFFRASNNEISISTGNRFTWHHPRMSDKDFLQGFTLFTLLHEIGHWLDYKYTQLFFVIGIFLCIFSFLLFLFLALEETISMPFFFSPIMQAAMMAALFLLCSLLFVGFVVYAWLFGANNIFYPRRLEARADTFAERHLSTSFGRAMCSCMEVTVEKVRPPLL